MRERDALLCHLAGSVWPAAPLLNALRLPPELDLLDVGAGDGRLLAESRERGHMGRLVGVDPRPGPGVMAGHAEALPFPAASFDAVLFVRVLAHLARPEAALAEARRVLRPGGRVVVASHGPDHLRGLWRVLSEAEPAPAGDSPDSLSLHFPVLLTQGDAHALAGSYGKSVHLDPVFFPLADTLHVRVEFR